MQSNYHEHYDAFFAQQMNRVLGDDIELIETAENFAVRGWFLIKFWYRPGRLFIIVDADYGFFSVRFEQEDGCFAHLSQIQRYERKVSFTNIEKVVDIIKHVIDKPMTLYKSTGRALYRKEGDEFIELSQDDIREMINKSK